MKDRYFELKNLIGAILLLLIVVSGCQKGDPTLGINLLPGVKILETLYLPNKMPISTAIFTDTKIRVDHPQYNLLGSFNDPVFGRTDASFATQFRLPYHPAYKVSALLDSIVLKMTYKKIYGDTISNQTVQVYELLSDLNLDAKYLSSFNLKNNASSELLGTSTFVPKFRTDSLQADTTEQTVRVRLKASFANKLLLTDSLKMTSNDEFLKVFKGLYISSSPVSRRGTLVSINASASMIVLYYHDPVLRKDTLGFAYRVSANSADVSSYVHDYTFARFNSNLDKENNLDSLIYIQPTGGIKSKVQVPSLSLWKDSVNCAINKATLTFHVDTIMSDYRRYSMPSRIYLKVINESGEEEMPADSQLSSSYYGGFYSSSTATYSFNVTQHLQQLIKGLNDGTKHNNGFYLVHSDRNGSAQRVVLKGFRSAKPAELNITYTRYK